MNTKRFDAMRAELHARFPLAFPADHQPRLPLALGIYHEVRKQMGWKAQHANWFLHIWTNREKYLAGLAGATHRINLAGEPVEAVLAEHRAVAKGTLALVVKLRLGHAHHKRHAPPSRQRGSTVPGPAGGGAELAGDAKASAREPVGAG